MPLKLLFVFCIFLIATIGCQSGIDIDTELLSSPSVTPIQQLTASPSPRVNSTEQVEIPNTILIQPTPRHPIEYQTGTPTDKAQKPIFLEVIQTTIIGENSIDSLTLGVGPTLYFYNPENNVLMLHPTITQKSNTEVMVGSTTILQTPGQIFEKREIVQFPFDQPGLLQIVSIEAGTSKINLIYADEAFELAPGESRAFKQVDNSSNSPSIITTISNWNRLADIQPILYDGSLR